MKKLLAVVVAVAALSIGLASVANAQPVGGPECNSGQPTIVDLVLDDGTPVGDVIVECLPGPGILTMTFIVNSPYILLEIHGFVENVADCPGVEVTKMGNPKAAKFPESMAFKKSEKATMATLTFSIVGFAEVTGCGVGHADLRNLDAPRHFDEAWGAGTLFPNPDKGGDNPSGATYFDIDFTAL